MLKQLAQGAEEREDGADAGNPCKTQPDRAEDVGRSRYDDVSGKTSQANMLSALVADRWLFRLERLARCQHFKNADTRQSLDDEQQVQRQEVGQFAVFNAPKGPMVLEVDNPIVLNGRPDHPRNQKIAKYVAARTVGAEVEMGAFVNEQLQIGDPKS